MNAYGPLVFLGLMTLCVAGFHGGILYGVRFLRQQRLIDTGTFSSLFSFLSADIGPGYRLFYRAHAEAHGRPWTVLALCIHFGGLAGFLILLFLADTVFIQP